MGKPSRGARRPGAAAAPAQAAAPNMFETLWSRRKFNVLGKKQKGEGKRLGQLRSRAIDKRKKTILQEFKQRHKSNAFVDRRFGEYDEDMGEDEKAVLRLKRERQLQIKRQSKFALADEDGEDVLTHKGAALSTLDDFEDDVSDEDEDGEPLRAETVRDLNFGGDFSGRGVNHKEHKSRKEVMEEVIAKSKHYKALKSKEKEEDSTLREKLDEDFRALSKDPALLSLVKPKKVNALKALFAKVGDGTKKTSGSAVSDVPREEEQEKPDEYDKLMKEMVFELRAQASDRLKTSEEIAKEEKERLEELEKKRKKRMLDAEDSEDEQNDSDSDKGKRKRKKRVEMSGDDLGENFVLEDEYQDKGWVDEVMARRGISSEASEMDDEGDADEDEEDEEDDEEDEDANQDEDESDGEGESEEDDGQGEGERREDDRENEEVPKVRIKAPHETQQKDVKQEAEAGELPFVIDAPQSLEEFKRLIAHRPTKELETAIERIRACNSVSLAAENRRKMQIFYNVLLLYFSEVASGKSLSLERINTLTKPLVLMSSETPYFAAVCARERLVRMQQQLTEKLRAGEKCSPSVRVLCLLRLWSIVFPASDFRHVVVTPMMLLMGEYLVRCPVNTGRDVCVGAFLCSLTLSVMRHARRFCPEALSFLLALLSSGLADDSACRRNCSQYLRDLIVRQPWLRLKQDKSQMTEAIEPLRFVDVMTAEENSEMFDTDLFRIGILNACLETLKGFLAIYDDLVSYPEVFAPYLPILLELSANLQLPQSLKASCLDTLKLIKARIQEHVKFRQPLRMRVKKPAPIKQFNPKFEESYMKGRDYDIDRERAEKKKLLKQLKREAKGAARELRKDNQFLAAEKARENAEARQEREEKYKKAMSFLQEQEAAAKSGQLGKKRRKR